MSSRLAMQRALLPSTRTLLRTVNQLFPPGAPVSTSTFLQALAEMVGADLASLLLLRLDRRSRRGFMLLHSVLHSMAGRSYTQFDDHLRSDGEWAQDWVTQRLVHRFARRPGAGFCYSARAWLRQLDGQASFTRTFLDALQVHFDINSVEPVDDHVVSVLSIYRTSTWHGPQAFTRHERRLVGLMHETFRHRIIDLRARRLRDELPEPCRGTFSLLLAGHTEKEIAKLTHKSPNTVHDHVKRIYSHFGVSSRAQLLSRFVDVERLRAYKA